MKDATNNEKLAMTLKPMIDALEKVSGDVVRIGITFKELDSIKKALRKPYNESEVRK